MGSFNDVKKFLDVFTDGCDTGYLGLTAVAERVENDQGKYVWGANYVHTYGDIDAGRIELAPEMFMDIEEAEVYFIPAILNGESHHAHRYVQSNVIWIDFDADEVPWQDFNPAPSVVVQTNPTGRVHCYWLLKEPIKDPNDQKYWNTRLSQYFSEFGADPSGVDVCQLMKVPFGKNLKPENNGYEPTLVHFEPKLRYTEAAFDHIQEPSISIVPVVDATPVEMPILEKGWSAYYEEYKGRIPDKTSARLKVLKEPRFQTLYALQMDLFKEFTREETFRLLCGSPNDKFTQDHGPVTGPPHLWEDIVRVHAKSAVERAQAGSSEVISTIMESKDSSREKGLKVSDHVLTKLSESGRFLQTDVGDYFYVDERADIPKLYTADVGRKGQIAGLVSNRFGLDPGVDRTILEGVLHKINYECQEAQKLTFHRFTHYDQEKNIVYVDRYDGTMYVLDGEEVSLKPHGVNDVFFYRTDNEKFPMPFSYNPEYKKGGLDALILEGPCYSLMMEGISKKQIKHILKTWVAAFFFPSIMQTKPIVLFHGEPDSGKTTFFQNLSIMFTGDETRAVIPMPTDTRNFNVQVSQDPYVFYDNVQVNQKEIQEKLAQVATGYSVRDRKLNTNKEFSVMKARAFVGITSVTLERIQRDVAQRYLIIPVHPRIIDSRSPRRALSAILMEVLKNRDALWSELLDFVNKILNKINRSGIENTGSTLRMADYGALLDITSSLEGLSVSVCEHFIKKMQTETMMENDPIFAAMKIHLNNLGPEGTGKLIAKDLYEQLVRVDRKVARTYDSPRKFAAGMRAYVNGGQFKYAGIGVEVTAFGGTQRYRLYDVQVGESEQ